MQQMYRCVYTEMLPAAQTRRPQRDRMNVRERSESEKFKMQIISLIDGPPSKNQEWIFIAKAY